MPLVVRCICCGKPLKFVDKKQKVIEVKSMFCEHCKREYEVEE